MRNLSSWLIVMFMGMFWLFRLVVALSAQFQFDFGGFICFDLKIEIILLFTTILSIILVLKKHFSGPIVYLGTYGYYFGGYIFNTLMNNSGDFSISVIQNMLVAVIGLLLAIFSTIDLIVDKATRKNHSDGKTDWYYKDKKYDRQYDERADRNQYRNF